MGKVILGIARVGLAGGMNTTFRSLPSNVDKLYLEQYLARYGFILIDEDALLSDSIFNWYRTERGIETAFLPFIAAFKAEFKFRGNELAYVKNPTEEQLDAPVPESFPFAFGRTFMEYLACFDPSTGQNYVEINGDVYYKMYCYNLKNDNGTYTSKDYDETEKTFWPLAEYFGLEKVVLALDFDKL